MSLSRKSIVSDELDSALKDILFLPNFSEPAETKSRTIGIYGPVTEESCNNAVSGLIYFRDVGRSQEVVYCEEDQEEVVKEYNLPIELYISTEGGQVPDMFSVYDCMRDVRKDCDVLTFGLGKVMSAGVLILAAGTKGKRKVGRNCRLMIHSLQGGQYGSIKELEVDIKEVKWYQQRYIESLSRETNLTERQIKNFFRRKTDTFFDAKQALEWGIVDEIV
jgi:ATP-dependent Clp endopeptidase proteolytic subunit ClpP